MTVTPDGAARLRAELWAEAAHALADACLAAQARSQQSQPRPGNARGGR
jgi:hypothetical protein